jgi:phosphoserine aminotransferase
VYIAGQVLKKLLKTYPNKVDGQQAVSEKKAAIIYGALEAHPEVYRIVPDKAVRSRMNICFRVTKVSGVSVIPILGRRDEMLTWTERKHR